MKPKGPVIVEESLKQRKPVASESVSLDLQDYLVITGVMAGESAAVCIWWPAALILACLFSFGFAYMIEIAKAKEAKLGNPRP